MEIELEIHWRRRKPPQASDSNAKTLEKYCNSDKKLNLGDNQQSQLTNSSIITEVITDKHELVNEIQNTLTSSVSTFETFSSYKDGNIPESKTLSSTDPLCDMSHSFNINTRKNLNLVSHNFKCNSNIMSFNLSEKSIDDNSIEANQFHAVRHKQ